jgi:Beta-propeller repeat
MSHIQFEPISHDFEPFLVLMRACYARTMKRIFWVACLIAAIGTACSSEPRPETAPSVEVIQPDPVVKADPPEVFAQRFCSSLSGQACGQGLISVRNEDLNAQAQFDPKPAAPVALPATTWKTDTFRVANTYAGSLRRNQIPVQSVLDARDHLITAANERIDCGFGPTDGCVVKDEFEFGSVQKLSNQTRIWAHQIGLGQKRTRITGMALDSKQNIYVSGETQNNLDQVSLRGESDGFLIKLAPDGKRLWTRLIGASGREGITGIALDAQDCIYVTGSSDQGVSGLRVAGQQDQFLMALNPQGQHLWTTMYGSSENETATRIVVLGQKIYIRGETPIDPTRHSNSSFNTRHHLAQYDLNGRFDWVRTFDEFELIGPFRVNDAIVIGFKKYLETTARVIRYDTDGAQQWTYRLPNASLSDLKVNAAGLWLAGQARVQSNKALMKESAFPVKCGSSDIWDGFVIHLDAAGLLKSAAYVMQTSDLKDAPSDLRCGASITLSLDRKQQVLAVVSYTHGNGPVGNFGNTQMVFEYTNEGQRIGGVSLGGSGGEDSYTGFSDPLSTSSHLIFPVSEANTNIGSYQFYLRVVPKP